MKVHKIEADVLGRVIQTACAAREMSHTDLAKKTNRTAASISLLLSGKRKFRMDTINAIANAIGMEPWQLYLLATPNPQLENKAVLKEALDISREMLLAPLTNAS